jgi:hypothetical protein
MGALTGSPRGVRKRRRRGAFTQGSQALRILTPLTFSRVASLEGATYFPKPRGRYDDRLRPNRRMLLTFVVWEFAWDFTWPV